MNYYRLLLFILLGSISQSLAAQNKVKLNISIEPNKTYKNDMSVIMDMEMTPKVDAATLATITATGVKFPMVMHMTQDIGVTTQTSSKQADKTIPLTMTYDRFNITSVVAGKETAQNNNPFANAVIVGHTMGDYKITIDSIKGELDEAMKTSLTQIVNNMQQDLKYPTTEMKIGDSFDQEIPMNLPIQGADVKMKIATKYILKEIKGNKAIFDMQQNLSMDMNKNENNIQMNGGGSGTGKGVMVYNTEQKIAELSDSNIQFEFNFNVSGIEMNASCKCHSKTTSSIQL